MPNSSATKALRYTAWTTDPDRPQYLYFVDHSRIRIIPLPWNRDLLPAKVPTLAELKRQIGTSLHRTYQYHLSSGIVYRLGIVGKNGLAYSWVNNFDPGRLRISSTREALALPAALPNSCAACAATQLRWIYGMSDTQNEYEAARLVNLSLATGTLESDFVIGLWKSGFEQVELSAWNYKRFLAEGLAYAQSYYGKRLWNQFKSYLTQNNERIYKNTSRQATLYQQHGLEQPGSRYKREPREATVRDIYTYLQRGYTIVLPVGWDSVDSLHSVVVLGTYGDELVVYNPSYQPRFELWSKNVVAALWNPKRGPLLAVRPA